MAALMEVLFFMSLILCSISYSKVPDMHDEERIPSHPGQSQAFSLVHAENQQKDLHVRGARQIKIETHGKPVSKKANVFQNIESIRKHRQAELESRRRNTENKNSILGKAALEIHANSHKEASIESPKHRKLEDHKTHVNINMTNHPKKIPNDFYLLILSPFVKISTILIAILICYIAFKFFLDKKIDQSIQMIKEIKKRKQIEECSLSDIEVSKQFYLKRDIKSYLPYIEYINEKRSKNEREFDLMEKHFASDESTLIFGSETANDSSDEQTEYLKLIHSLDLQA